MADIVFITAPIGGGKSLFATKAICEELRKTERMIVTNVPVYLEDAPTGKITLGEWCHEFADKPIDVRKRVRVLTDKEVYQFFRYLPGLDLPMVERSIPIFSDKEGKDVTETRWVPDLGQRQDLQVLGTLPRGCLFVIDEVHNFFGAREWQKISGSVGWYMSHLRKFNDDLLLVTQHPDKVDKNFRRDATEWIYMQNMSKTRLFGGVTLPGWFRFHTFPHQASRQDKPSTTGKMNLATERYRDCYDTMAGVGLSGKMMPEEMRLKGNHWIVWVAICAVLVFAAFMIPRLVMRSAGMAAGSLIGNFSHGFSQNIIKGGKTNESVKVSNVVVPSSSRQVQQNNVVSSPDSVGPIDSRASSVAGDSPINGRSDGSAIAGDDSVEPVTMTGHFGLSGHYIVFLSDGRSLDSYDPRMQRLSERGVRWDGHWYAYVPDRVLHHKKDHDVFNADSSPLPVPEPGRNFEREPAAVAAVTIPSTRRYVFHMGQGEAVVKEVPETEGSGQSDVDVITVGNVPELGQRPLPSSSLGAVTTGTLQGQFP